jgi:hypothetical protein
MIKHALALVWMDTKLTTYVACAIRGLTYTVVDSSIFNITVIYYTYQFLHIIWNMVYANTTRK